MIPGCENCRGDKCTVCSRDLDRLFNESNVLRTKLVAMEVLNPKMAAIELLQIIDLIEHELRNHWLNPTSLAARDYAINAIAFYLERKSKVK